MIPEYKLYHGSVLADIVDKFDGAVSFREIMKDGRLLNYVLNESVGLQIKFATQRLRPWHFSFPESHIKALQELNGKYSATFLVLVCRTDGIIAIDAEHVLPSLMSASSGQAWLRADRKKREMYRIYGPDGEFPVKLKTTVSPIIEALSQDIGSNT